jgi:sugar (pentulose or hexulose) kinase
VGGEALDLGLGVDLGSSGLRLALVDCSGGVLIELSSPYPQPFDQPEGWRQGLIHLLSQLPGGLRQRVRAISLDGTSGTLLACSADGMALGAALSYSNAYPQHGAALAALLPGGGPAASPSGSLARSLSLLEQHPQLAMLRHQADWVMGWLLGDWRWGEAGNNLRLGWDQQLGVWSGAIGQQPWSYALPKIVTSGTRLGSLHSQVAINLQLPNAVEVVAGCTDGTAAALAADPQPGDGISVLGTTTVLKQFAAAPLQGAGISNHLVAGRWLVGGASNAGAGVLLQFFPRQQLQELSRQIDPLHPSGIKLRPLASRGERFPIEDPLLEPLLEPRPVSDALYLQALLEALSQWELLGWQRLQQLGAPAISRVISVGGGAQNPQWRLMRERLMGLPVINKAKASAAAAMARHALRSVTLNPAAVVAP